MFAQLNQKVAPLPTVASPIKVPRVTAVCLLLGLLISGLLIMLFPFPPLAACGVCLLSLGSAAIAGAFVSHLRRQAPLWGWALAGQALGMAGIALLCVAVLLA